MSAWTSTRPIWAFIQRRYWTVVALVALAAFGSGWQAKRVSTASPTRLMNQKVAAASPLPSFEVKRTERLTSERHHGKITFVLTMARRSDGAEAKVVENRTSPDRPIVERTLFFPSSAIRIFVDDTIRVKSTFYYRHTEPVFPHLQLMREDPATGCTKTLSGTLVHNGAVIEESLLGIPAVKIVTQDANVHTRWLAPQLGCIEVMTRHDWRENKGGFVASTTISYPDYIRLGEPDEGLFAVPLDYSEVKPSERICRLNAWMRQHFPEAPRSEAPRANEGYRHSADESYAKHRTPANP